MNVVVDSISWEFLDEPLWKWFVFLGALALMLWGWNGILAFIG